MIRPALSLALAAALAGCATVPDRGLAYRCVGTAAAPHQQAATLRLVDRRGHLLATQTRWIRRHDDMLDIVADWPASTAPLALATATYRFSLDYAFPKHTGRLTLSTKAGEVDGPWSTGGVRVATASGSQLATLLRDGETIWVALFNPRAQLMGATGVEAVDFAHGTALARQADLASRTASRDPKRHCQPEPRISKP